MLKLIIPILTLLILKKWSHAIHTLMFLSTLSIMLISPQFPSSMNLLTTLDSLSTPLISLSMWITALMLIASSKIKTSNSKTNLFMSTCILLLLFLLLSFSTNNLLLFYIFFESSLVPTLFLILIWGYQPERLQASMYMMMYTITASLPLLSIIMFIMSSSSLNMFTLQPSIFFNSLSLWWLLSMTAFMVKMPMYGLHLWLPKAHVEAPVAGSMILAGILLKLGSYGLIRLSFLFLPMNSSMTTFISAIAMVGGTMAGLTCIRQPDLKSLIAYSSVAHMALVTAGIMSNNMWGWEGALTMMLAHGLCSSALFALANISYESTQTRSLFLTKGMINLFPAMTIWWFLFASANLGAPPSMNLLSEILLIASILHTSSLLAIPIALLSFIGATYSLILFTSSQHGSPNSFTNPLILLTHQSHTLMILHAAPLFLLFMKSSIICIWL